MFPLISVIVPVYNKEKTIGRCIQSILNQSYDRLEIIMVDDGSCDESLNICKAYQKNHNSIKVIHQENRGVSAARNIGIENANGEFLMFVDSDDWLEPEIVEILYSHFDSSIDIVSCCCNALYENQIIINHFYNGNHFFKNNYDSKRDLYFQLLDTSYGQPQKEVFTGIGVPWAKLYRKKLFNENQVFFDEDMHHLEDNILNFKLFYLSNQIKYIDLPMYNYSTEHISSVLKEYNLKIVTSYLLAISRRYDFVKKHKDLYIKELYNKLELESLGLLEIVIFTMILNENRSLTKKELVSELKVVCEDYEAISFLKKVNLSIIKNRKVRLVYRFLRRKQYNIVYYFYMIRKKQNEIIRYVSAYRKR